MTSGAGMTVSELNQLITETLHREWRLRSVTVTAEISGFKNHFASGHWYFSLKDDSAAIPCVMFRQNNIHAAIRPKDGDRVTVAGYVEMYARDGRLQLYVQEMKPAGLGSMYEQLEALKRKLSAEGLFDPGRKRVLPRVPKKVAVITSASGAALHDILNVSGMRNPSVPIVLVPSGVQGEGSARELVSALEKAQRLPDVQVIILARGGGSAEDLWCFNDEALTRAIAACPIPVVTGVGHEVDTTLCDYAADYRASTPSNAAEVVFPDRSELRENIRYARTAMARAISERIHRERLRVLESRDRLQRISPDRRIRLLTDRARESFFRLQKAMEDQLRAEEEQLRRFRTRLPYSMEGSLQRRTAEVQRLRTRLPLLAQGMLQVREAGLQRLRTQLNAISPLKVLERGYVLVYDEGENLVPDAKCASRAGEMTLRFRDGRIPVIRKEQ